MPPVRYRYAFARLIAERAYLPGELVRVRTRGSYATVCARVRANYSRTYALQSRRTSYVLPYVDWPAGQLPQF